MNFYLLSVFVILCFGPWTIAREVYQGLSKTSSEVTEERSKKLHADARFPIINGFVQVASQAGTWIQWLRRLLKALKKWCNSHPYEVKLGKCFASYVIIKIPGPGQHGKIIRHHEDPKGAQSTWKISKKTPFRREVVTSHTGEKRIFAETFPEKANPFLYVRKFFIEIFNLFRHYRNVILRDNLLTCSWDYFWKKFWTWVELTPESRSQI